MTALCYWQTRWRFCFQLDMSGVRCLSSVVLRIPFESQLQMGMIQRVLFSLFLLSFQVEALGTLCLCLSTCPWWCHWWRWWPWWWCSPTAWPAARKGRSTSRWVAAGIVLHAPVQAWLNECTAGGWNTMEKICTNNSLCSSWWYPICYLCWCRSSKTTLRMRSTSLHRQRTRPLCSPQLRCTPSLCPRCPFPDPHISNLLPALQVR